MTSRKKIGGRTIQITHRGSSIMVKENHNGTCVLEFEDRQQPTDNKFPAAAREALTWLLKYAGEPKGDYARKDTRNGN